MAITLKEWLAKAGKDRAWFDALPKKQRDEVLSTAHHYNVEGSILAQLGSTPENPAAVAARIEQEAGKSKAKAKALAARSTEPELEAFLAQWGKDRAWFDALPADLHQQVLNQYSRSSTQPGFQFFESTSSIDTAMREIIGRSQAPVPSAGPTSAGPAPTPTPTGTTAPTGEQYRAAREAENERKLVAAGFPPDQIEAMRKAGTLDNTFEVDQQVLAATAARSAGSFGWTPEAAQRLVIVQHPRSWADLVPAGTPPEQAKIIRANLDNSDVVEQRRSAISVLTAPISERWDEARITALQKRLEKAFPQEMRGYRAGQFDDVTRTAYAKAVDEAINLGKTPDEIIDSYGRDKSRQFQYPSFQPSDYHPMSGEAIRVGIGEPTAAKTLGRARLTAAEEASVETATARLEARQRASQVESERRQYEYDKAQAKFNQGFSSTGPASQPAPVTSPDVTASDYTAAAENALRRAAPLEAGGHDLRDALVGFLRAIGG